MNTEELKQPKFLLEYCACMLGTHKDIGRVKLFRCPFGEHRRLKLHVNECDGVGLWRCWACDKGGDIFTLAAELKQLDIKAQFPDVFQLHRITGLAQVYRRCRSEERDGIFWFRSSF